MIHYRTCRKFRKLLSLFVCIHVFLSGCNSAIMNQTYYACPPIYLIKQAETFKRFEYFGQEKTEGMLFEAKIIDFQGKCVYEKNKSALSVSLSINFEIVRGPKNRDGKIDFNYFVAIPKFYPDAQGKRIFSISEEFEEQSKRRRIVDELVIKVPIQKKQSFDQYQTYIGFQLSSQQIKYNK